MKEDICFFNYEPLVYLCVKDTEDSDVLHPLHDKPVNKETYNAMAARITQFNTYLSNIGLGMFRQDMKYSIKRIQ